MRSALILITLVSSFACTQPEEVSCTVEQTDEGALISCPDGSEVLVADGTAGTDGTLITTIIEVGPSEECPAGGRSFLVDGVEQALDCNTHVEYVEEAPGDNCDFGGTKLLVDGDLVGYDCNSRHREECDVFLAGSSLRLTDAISLEAVRGCRVIRFRGEHPSTSISVDVVLPVDQDLGDTFFNLERVEFGGISIGGTSMTSFREVFPKIESTDHFIFHHNALSDITGIEEVVIESGYAMFEFTEVDVCDVTEVLDMLPEADYIQYIPADASVVIGSEGFEVCE